MVEEMRKSQLDSDSGFVGAFDKSFGSCANEFSQCRESG